MRDPRRYSLPEPLLQAIVNALSELPARVSRGLLNAIEGECLQQDAQSEAEVQTPARRPRAKTGGPT
jgi:hypothetical protein